MHARRALLVAGVIGLSAGLYVWWYYVAVAPAAWSDFDQIWIGARALLTRQDPYTVVRATFPWPLFYPVTAVLAGLPFATLPLPGARIAFAAMTAGITTWAILRYRPYLWPALCSLPFLFAVQRGQWVPLLLLVALAPSPATGLLLTIKPNVSLPLIAARLPPRAALLGAAGFGTCR